VILNWNEELKQRAAWSSGPGTPFVAGVFARTLRRRQFARWMLAASGMIIASVAVGVVMTRRDGATADVIRIVRTEIVPSGAAALNINDISRSLAITPDGRSVVYVGAGGTTIFVRQLDSLEAAPLAHGVSLRHPFLSPDGHWVGFFDGAVTLKKVPITGGAASLVVRLDNREEGATWAGDGAIVFATNSTVTGLQRVSPDGGAATVLTHPDRMHGEVDHGWPELIPGRQAVLFTVTAATGPDADSIVVLDLRTGKMATVLKGARHAQYSASGHLMYASAGTLRAVRFDPNHPSVVGESHVVIPQVVTTPAGAVEAALASDGTLVYVAGEPSAGTARTLVWVDREGRETPVGAPRQPYYYPRIFRTARASPWKSWRITRTFGSGTSRMRP
jgi:hypothetical protein